MEVAVMVKKRVEGVNLPIKNTPHDLHWSNEHLGAYLQSSVPNQWNLVEPVVTCVIPLVRAMS